MFIILKSFLCFLVGLRVHLPRQPLILLLSVPFSLHFLQFYKNGAMQYALLWGLVSFTQHHWDWQPTPVLPGKSRGWRSLVGCSPWGCWGSDSTEWLHFHALEKEMATHCSVLAWRIPGTGEPGGLPSMGSHRVGHDWSDLAAVAACINILFFLTVE